MNIYSDLGVSKPNARALVINLLPVILSEVTTLHDPVEWENFSSNIAIIRRNLKLDAYVQIYENPQSISLHLSLSKYSQSELDELRSSLSMAGTEAQQSYIDTIAEDGLLALSRRNEILQEMKACHAGAEARFSRLSAKEQEIEIVRGQNLWMSMLAYFHEVFAVLMYGEKMTSLVPKALNGDDIAFRKAVRIDKNLLFSHNYFRGRYERALAEQDADFLRPLLSNMGLPPFGGRIIYPGFYALFALLENFNCFDAFTHAELLDISVEAKFSDWHGGEVFDVVTVSKLIHNYKSFQSENRNAVK